MHSSSNGLAERSATLTFASPLIALAQRVADYASRLWATYWHYQLRRATVRMLEALDDRMLKDIGLTRDIEPTGRRRVSARSP